MTLRWRRSPALATAAGKLAYSTGVDAWAEADITLQGTHLACAGHGG
jgi:hypothetical protein